MTSDIPEDKRPWTAAELDAFIERITAEVEAALTESPRGGRALLAERATLVVAELTAIAEGILRLVQQMHNQGAAPEDVRAVRLRLDRIMGDVGEILDIAMKHRDADS